MKNIILSLLVLMIGQNICIAEETPFAKAEPSSKFASPQAVLKHFATAIKLGLADETTSCISHDSDTMDIAKLIAYQEINSYQMCKLICKAHGKNWLTKPSSKMPQMHIALAKFLLLNKSLDNLKIHICMEDAYVQCPKSKVIIFLRKFDNRWMIHSMLESWSDSRKKAARKMLGKRAIKLSKFIFTERNKKALSKNATEQYCKLWQKLTTSHCFHSLAVQFDFKRSDPAITFHHYQFAEQIGNLALLKQFYFNMLDSEEQFNQQVEFSTRLNQLAMRCRKQFGDAAIVNYYKKNQGSNLGSCIGRYLKVHHLSENFRIIENHATILESGMIIQNVNGTWLIWPPSIELNLRVEKQLYKKLSQAIDELFEYMDNNPDKKLKDYDVQYLMKLSQIINGIQMREP